MISRQLMTKYNDPLFVRTINNSLVYIILNCYLKQQNTKNARLLHRNSAHHHLSPLTDLTNCQYTKQQKNRSIYGYKELLKVNKTSLVTFTSKIKYLSL